MCGVFHQSEREEEISLPISLVILRAIVDHDHYFVAVAGLEVTQMNFFPKHKGLISLAPSLSHMCVQEI